MRASRTVEARFTVPLLSLLAIAVLAGLGTLAAFERLAASPHEPATPAVGALRCWWRARTDRRSDAGLALTAAVAIAVGGAVVVAALALVVRGSTTGFLIDPWIAHWAHSHASRASTRVIWWITALGDFPVVPVVGILVVLSAYRALPNRALTPFVVSVIAGNQIITAVLKVLVDRSRPALNPIAHTLGPAFPSGHSSTAASFYAALALVLARGRSPRIRGVLAGGAVALAVAVAASRVLLDVHWLSDVVGGLALGWAWFAVCAIAFGASRARIHRPSARAPGIG